MTISGRSVRNIALSALAAGTALVAAVAPASGAAMTVPKIDFKQRTLANGLKVVSIRDTSTPDVMVSMWYDVGSKHDDVARKLLLRGRDPIGVLTGHDDGVALFVEEAGRCETDTGRAAGDEDDRT